MAQDGVDTPALSVRINGTALPAEALGDLQEVTVQEDVEALGMFALHFTDWDPDRLQVQWMDHALFTEGNEVQIQLGYEGDAALTTLMLGDITGLEPEFSADDLPRLVVRGYDQRHRLARGHKTRTFVRMTDSDIARQIATDAGLRAQVDSTEVRLDYVLQHNQTDLDFLHERAQRLGYEVVVQDKTLYFRQPPVQQQAAVTLALNQELVEFFPRLTTMAQVQHIGIRAWDAKQKTAIVGQASTTAGMGGDSTGPRATQKAFGRATATGVQRPVFTKAEADQMAQGQFHDMALSYLSGEGVCFGHPEVRAGVVIRIEGAGRRFSGLYYVTAVTHTLSAGQGYRTAFTVRRNATSWR